MNKKISVIMPSYNHDKYIAEGISSVIGQTYKHWELIIVDDGSKDKSLEIIKGYVDQYTDQISLYTHPNHENIGLKETYQLGLQKATGDYIAFLESDDVFCSDSLEKRVQVLQEHPEVGLVYSDVELFGPKSEWMQTIGGRLTYFRKKSLCCMQDGLFIDRLVEGNFIPTFSCVIIRKDILLQGDLDVPHEYEAWLDLWLWMTFSLRTKFYYLSSCLIRWRIYPKSQNAVKTAKNENVHRQYKRYLELLGERVSKEKKT